MKTYQELLHTDTFWITKIQNDLYNAVEDYLAENKMTRTQFAEKLGVSKGYVTQLLSGEFNHRLSKLIEVSLAIGKAPMLEFEDLKEVAEKEAKGMVRKRAGYVPRALHSVYSNFNGKMLKNLEKTTIEKEESLSSDELHWRNYRSFEASFTSEFKLIHS